MSKLRSTLRREGATVDTGLEQEEISRWREPCACCGGTGWRIDTDAALIIAIATHVGSGIAFTSRELLRHARIFEDLRDAIGGMGARAIGKALHRAAGREIDGFRVERIGEVRGGTLWQIYNRV